MSGAMKYYRSQDTTTLLAQVNNEYETLLLMKLPMNKHDHLYGKLNTKCKCDQFEL